MTARTDSASACLLLAILLGGCVEIEPRAGFEEVKAELAERYAHRIVWRDGGEGEAEVAAAVDALLARPLVPATAAQIALLENRELQAVYRELGIGRAELIQAGLLKNPIFDAELEIFGGAGANIFEFGVLWDFLDVFYVPLRVAVAEQRWEAVKQRVAAAVIDLGVETELAMIQHQARLQEAEVLRRALVASTDELEGSWLALELAAAEAEALLSREELNTLMGLFGARAAWTAAPTLQTLPPAEGLEEAEREAISRSLDLAAAERDIAALAEGIGLERASVAIPHGKAGVSAEKIPGGSWLAGPAVSVSVPVLDTGKAAEARATSRLRRAYDRYWALAVRVRAEVRAARTRHLAASARADHLRTVLLPLARDADVGRERAVELEIQAIRAHRDALSARTVLEAMRRGRVPERRFGLGRASFPLDADSLRFGGSEARAVGP